MLIKRLIYVMLTLILSATAQAQDSLLFRDYRFVKRFDPWLTSDNAAGLTRYRSSNIAEAEIAFGMGRGGFVNYNESPKTITLDASVESFYRISPKVVVFGRMAYDNYTGRNMTGSAFMNREQSGGHGEMLPFDIVEDSLTNEGRKHSDTYQLTGAVGVDLKKLSLGARVDYTAANYAKYKDLRHKNKLMDLTATAGLSVPLGSRLTIGADYRYHRSNESITFGTYGKNDKVYKSLVSYAAFMGRVEQFGNYGYTDKSREMPLFDTSHGLGVQIDIVPLRELSFFSEFSYSHRSGYYGRRSPYTITYTSHSGNRYSYSGCLTYSLGRQLHKLDLHIGSEKLQNNSSNWRELINDAGSSYYEYYDDVKTSDKVLVNMSLSYTVSLGIRHELPAWVLGGTLGLMHRKQTGYLYPYYRRQDIRNTSLDIHACRNVVIRKGVLSVGLGFGYLNGSGDICEDGTFATPSDKQSAPASMDAFLWREYEWLTSPQYAINASGKYAFVFPGTHLNTFTRLGISHLHTNSSNALLYGKNHTQITLAVGCTF